MNAVTYRRAGKERFAAALRLALHNARHVRILFASDRAFFNAIAEAVARNPQKSQT